MLPEFYRDEGGVRAVEEAIKLTDLYPEEAALAFARLFDLNGDKRAGLGGVPVDDYLNSSLGPFLRRVRDWGIYYAAKPKIRFELVILLVAPTPTPEHVQACFDEALRRLNR